MQALDSRRVKSSTEFGDPMRQQRSVPMYALRAESHTEWAVTGPITDYLPGRRGIFY
jgi:hypothetical protein